MFLQGIPYAVGILRGHVCPISGKKFVSTTEQSAELEEHRLQQEHHTAALISEIGRRFGFDDSRTAAAYNLLWRTMGSP